MASSFRQLAALTPCLLLAGCPLPIPHDRLLSPMVYGTVRDGESRSPISGVSVRMEGGTKWRSATTVTDNAGNYRVGLTEPTNWFVILPAPAEGVCEGRVTFTHAEYEPLSFKEGGFGSASFDGPCTSVKRDVVLWKKK